MALGESCYTGCSGLLPLARMRMTWPPESSLRKLTDTIGGGVVVEATACAITVHSMAGGS